MVAIDPNTIREHRYKRPTLCMDECGRRIVKVRLPDSLYEQILSEAIKRQWPVARMIRHLCEASIEGIE